MEQSHLSEHELSKYINRQLNDSLRKHHVKTCLYCQKQVLAYRLIDQFLESEKAVVSIDNTFAWNKEVLAQIEQIEHRREKRSYFWLIAGCLIGWAGIIAWLVYIGLFNNLWQVLSDPIGRSIIPIGIGISILICCLDWLEKRLSLDPLRIVLNEKGNH